MNDKFDSALAHLMSEARRYPLLTEEHEREIVTAWRTHRDRVAVDELVGSHLRLVLKMARGFVGYGLPLADLVGEGSLGLMQAANRFEPERGFRFATYALWWVRAAMQKYVLHSWSMVAMGTTGAQKKLFFNLRRLMGRLREFADGVQLSCSPCLADL